MTVPVRPDPLEELMALKQQRDPLDELLASKPKRDFHEEYRKGLLGPRMARENANEREALENPLAAATGEIAKHAATVAQGIPGMERLQAGIGSLVSGNDYKTSLADLRGETETIHPAVRFAEKLAGGLPLGALIPGGAAKTLGQAVKTGAKAGASLGAADAALDADEMSLGDRALGTAEDGALGGVLGGVVGGAAKGVQKGRELNAVRKQVNAAKPLDTRAIELDKEIEQATRANYGQAEAEGAANGGTSPALAKALEHPRVAKFVELIRGGDEGTNMSDADVARSAYKLMSKQRRGLKSQMEVTGYDAAKDLEAERIGNAMKQLKDATAAASQKPPITLEIAGETSVVEPKITPGRETLQGHAMEGTAGRARGDAAQVAVDASGKVARVSPGEVQGPAGPAFQLRGQPDKVRPGVEIQTPSMRVQTAPAEDVGPLMPSFPRAVSEKARMEGERSAFNEGSDAGKRIMRGTSIPGKRLVDKSPEAFRAKERTPGEAARAKEGVLGRAKEEIKIKPANTMWQSLLNLGRPASRLNAISPLLDDLDRQAGNAPRQSAELEQILKLMGLANAPLANR